MGFDSKFRRGDRPTKEPTPIVKINVKINVIVVFCRFLNTLDSPHYKKNKKVFLEF